MVVGNQEWSPVKKEKTIEDVIKEIENIKDMIIYFFILFLVLYFSTLFFIFLYFI